MSKQIWIGTFLLAALGVGLYVGLGPPSRDPGSDGLGMGAANPAVDGGQRNAPLALEAGESGASGRVGGSPPPALPDFTPGAPGVEPDAGPPSEKDRAPDGQPIAEAAAVGKSTEGGFAEKYKDVDEAGRTATRGVIEELLAAEAQNMEQDPKGASDRVRLLKQEYEWLLMNPEP